MITSPNELELGALRRLFQLSRGSFSLTTVVCNSPAQRTEICNCPRSEGQEFSEVHLSIDAFDPVAAVEQLVVEHDDRAIFIFGLNYLLAESTPGSEHLLNVFNRSRERWKSRFPNRATCIWLTEHTSSRLSMPAPDFRAWVSHELEFVGAWDGGRVDQASARIQSRNYTWLLNLSATEKEARLSELEQRAGSSPRDPALIQEWARANDEQLVLLESLMRFDEAERLIQTFAANLPVTWSNRGTLAAGDARSFGQRPTHSRPD